MPLSQRLLSADTALPGLALGLASPIIGMCIRLLRKTVSNTRLTFKILLPQVENIPVHADFAARGARGPRGRRAFPPYSLQAWLVLLINITRPISIFVVRGSAQPWAEVPCPWLARRGEPCRFDAPSFHRFWFFFFYSAKSFRTLNYIFCSSNLFFL